MKRQRKSVPIHTLKDRTDLGVELRYVDYNTLDLNQKPILEAHRDDHYIFILMTEGDAVFMIDFVEFGVKAPALIVILPGQVHHVISASQTEGWLFAIDTLLIANEFRNVFEEQWLLAPLQLSEAEKIICGDALNLAKQYLDRSQVSAVFQQEMIRSFVGVFTGLAAELYGKRNDSLSKVSRRGLSILIAFRKAVSTYYKQWKKASDYAGLLCLSPAYLNEVIKLTTGFPVSYWIRNEIILEAKRLLYYTDLTVKEIAATLGYEDHTYFTRIFTQDAQLAPGQFRKKYREKSNFSS